VALANLVAKSLLRTRYVTVEIDYSRRILILHRSSLAFRRLEEIDQTIAELRRAVSDTSRATCGVLIDMRDAPTRVQPSFDQGFQRYRDETERGFARIAVLVQTTLGKLRSDRLAETCRMPMEIFQSVDEALEWLKQ
jgi:hypothetical protein